jgi:hypothetical protein
MGMPAVSWNDLRHTSATFADQAGLTEAERQRILGHSNARTTKHYTHAEMAHVRVPMEAMADGFEKAMATPPGVIVITRKKKAS